MKFTFAVGRNQAEDFKSNVMSSINSVLQDVRISKINIKDSPNIDAGAWVEVTLATNNEKSYTIASDVIRAVLRMDDMVTVVGVPKGAFKQHS